MISARTCLGKLLLSWTEPRCLNTEEISDLPTRFGGVYVLMAFSSRFPMYVPYYVGQSEDVRRRLDEHTRSPKSFLWGMHRYARTYFATARVSNQVFRTAAEAALIRALEPVGNDQVPIALNVTVNPPPTGFFGENED